MEQDLDLPPPRKKRFAFQSYEQSLKSVHVPSSTAPTSFDEELSDNASHFYERLQQLQQLSLSPAFVKFADQASQLAESLPLLVHNWRQIFELWGSCVLHASSTHDQGDAIKPLLEVMKALFHDLRSTVTPIYPVLLKQLVPLLLQKLDPAALTELLATLVALFKYVLIPTLPSSLLAITWDELQHPLEKCDDEGRRMLGEVWGSALRRMKPDQREACITLMSGSLNSNPSLRDGIAWVIVAACQAPSRSLHACAPDVVSVLIRAHLAADDGPSMESGTLLRRVLTSLIHHSSGPAQFHAVSEVLVKSLKTHLEAHEVSLREVPLRRIMAVIETPCIVRKGVRMPQEHMAAIMSLMAGANVFTSEALRDAYGTLLVSVLAGAELSVWMGSGRKAVERIWEMDAVALRVAGILADSEWDGWASLIQPGVLMNVPRLLRGDSPVREIALRFVSASSVRSRLASTTPAWLSNIQEWAKDSLQQWVYNKASAVTLVSILSLAPNIIGPEITSELIGVTNTLVNLPADARHIGSCLDAPYLLARSIDTILRLGLDDLDSSLFASWLTHIIESSWIHNPHVIGSVVGICEARSHDLFPTLLTYEEVRTKVEFALTSHDRHLRIGALRILAACATLNKRRRDSHDILQFCLAAEKVPLDVAGVRERIVKTRRVGSMATKDVEEDVVRLASQWLLGQFQINLRPLWGPAAECLALIMERHPDIVWGPAFEELIRASRGDPNSDAEALLENINPEVADENVNDSEREASWRCPNGHRRRLLMRSWWLQPHHVIESYVHKLQGSKDRLDLRTYEVELLGAFARAPSVVEKQNRHFVPFFLALEPLSLQRRRLKAYLGLFAKFVNPKAMHASSALHGMHMCLLSKPDRELQELALNCLLTYKSPALRHHEEQLRAMLDETKWRDELSMLDIGSIQDENRSEVIRALIGILYGIIGERKGRKNNGPDHRAAVLQALCNVTTSELAPFIDLMLEPFPVSASEPITEGVTGFRGLGDASLSQQAGFLNLLEDVLKVMGTKTVEFWSRLLAVALEIVHSAQLAIGSTISANADDAGEETGTEALNLNAIGDENTPRRMNEPAKLRRAQRSLRQSGLKRVAEFFRLSTTAIDYTPYVHLAFPPIVAPRLPLLSQENTQAPSALLELFAEWSSSTETASYLTARDTSLLPRVFECLNGIKVKPSVVSKVLDIISNLITLSSEDRIIAENVLAPSVRKLLQELATMFERIVKTGFKAEPITQRMIDVLSSLSNFMTEPEDAARLLKLMHPLLRKPARIVPEKVKTNLLHVMQHMSTLVPECRDASSDAYSRCFDSLAFLFQSLRTRSARVELVSAFKSLVVADASLTPLSQLVASLNAYSDRRIDEPDFDKRLSAFAELNDNLYSSLTVPGWKVVICNMMFFIHDPEEVALRSSAAESLRLFIRVTHANSSNSGSTEEDSRCLLDLFDRTLYPSLRRALRSKYEHVRSDVLGVIAFAVEMLDMHQPLQELNPLLAAGDAEANFFNNIHHIQVHRRTRALRRLAEFLSGAPVRQSIIASLFLPIIEHPIAGVESHDHHLVNEAINTLGVLSRKLSWGSYYALEQRHLASAKEKSGSQKTRIRALIAILDNFPFEVSPSIEQETDKEGSEEGDDDVDGLEAKPHHGIADHDLQLKMADTLNQRLLPGLLSFMDQRDDVEDVIRLPVAVGIANVVQRMPDPSRHLQLERLTIILSQALRSKSQETRDVVRETLGRIAVMLGPELLPEILKQMQAALLRGTHLHILAFVTHSLLVRVTSPENRARFSNLDESVAIVGYIAAEVIFGQSGRDVMSEDFRTKIREVRGSATRGLDLFAIVAKYISPEKISSLLAPVRAIMHETEAAKPMKQVDDTLRRIASGLNANEHLHASDMLALCHTLISQNAKFLQQDGQNRPNKRKKSDVDVQIKRPQAEASTGVYTNNSFRFVVLGLDLFITAYRRGRFDFEDAAIMPRLESMVQTIGNTLYSTNAIVVSLGVRAAAAIARCPLRSLPKSLPVYVKRILAIIREAGSTDSDMVQHSLKSLAIIIRDCPQSKIQDDDLIFLLEFLIPDIEESERQIAVFALLRAIVSRKFVVPEIYDVMERVSGIMVTNQSKQVQELCRGVLLQFLLDYPQGKGRLRTQMASFAKNLSYIFESGRLSVMELLSAIIAKFDSALVQEYTDLLFVALFMVLANDDAAKCREAAAELVKSLHARSEESTRAATITRLHTWAAQGNSNTLRRTVAHVIGLIVETDAGVALAVLADLNDLLAASASALADAESSRDNDEPLDGSDVTSLDWQLPYHALTAVSKVLRAKSDVVQNLALIHWSAVTPHLAYPHAWVRLAATRLVEVLFGGFPPALPNAEASHPLSRDGLIDLAHKLCMQLQSPHLDDALSLQVVKNLFYVGRCFNLWPECRALSADPSAKNAEKQTTDNAIGEAEEEANTGSGGEQEDAGTYKNKAAENPMRWLFSRLSYQARSAHLARRNRKNSSEASWSAQPLSVLRWFAAMVSHLSKDDVAQFLTHILMPTYRIIEDDTVRDSQMDDLRNTAQELQALVQEKVGTTLFVNEYSRIRQGILDVRRERRVSKALQITTAPQLAAKRKIQRNANKKASRKRKHQEFTNEKIKMGLKRARFQ